MKEFLSQNDIAFITRLVDDDPVAFDEMVEKTGARSTPTTLIGEEVVVGFDKKRLEALLGIAKEEKKMEEKDKKKKFGWLGSFFSGLMSSA